MPPPPTSGVNTPGGEVAWVQSAAPIHAANLQDFKSVNSRVVTMDFTPMSFSATLASSDGARGINYPSRTVVYLYSS